MTEEDASPRTSERIDWSMQVPTIFDVDAPAGPCAPRSLSGLIALHGMGQSADLFQGMIEELRAPDRLVVTPQGPLPFEVRATRGVGHAWYVYGGDKRRFLSYAAAAETYLMALADRVCADERVDPERLFLFGYSQGGYLAARLALLFPERFAGAVVIGAYMDPAMDTGALAQKPERCPVIVLHGEKDQFVPFRNTHAAATHLQDRGFDVRFVRYGSGHRLSTEQLRDAATWLRELDVAAADRNGSVGPARESRS